METIRRVGSHFGSLIMGVALGAVLGFGAAAFIHMRHRPRSVYTPLRLEHTVSPDPNSVFVEANVDSRGRVWNYRVLSNGKGAEDLSPEIKNSLIFATFRPATYMGTPVDATVVLSFPKSSSERR
jgi:hypothetical protein